VALSRPVESPFTPDGHGRTLVCLEHRHFEDLADGTALRDGVSSAGGWLGIVAGFAARATSPDR